MSHSWGQAIRSLTAEERARYYPTGPRPRPVWNAMSDADWVASEPERQARERHCSVRCPNEIAFVTSYRYVTGRAGRISFQERRVCHEHGARFAAKYGLVLPDPDVTGTRAQGSRGVDVVAAALQEMPEGRVSAWPAGTWRATPGLSIDSLDSAGLGQQLDPES